MTPYSHVLLLFAILVVCSCTSADRDGGLCEGLHDVLVIVTEKDDQFDDVVLSSESDAENTAFLSGIVQKRKYLIANDGNSVVMTIGNGSHESIIETQNFSIELHGEQVGSEFDVVVNHVRTKKASDDKGLVNMSSSIAPGHKVFLGFGGKYNYYLYMPISTSRLQQHLQTSEDPKSK